MEHTEIGVLVLAPAGAHQVPDTPDGSDTPDGPDARRSHAIVHAVRTAGWRAALAMTDPTPGRVPPASSTNAAADRPAPLVLPSAPLQRAFALAAVVKAHRPDVVVVDPCEQVTRRILAALRVPVVLDEGTPADVIAACRTACGLITPDPVLRTRDVTLAIPTYRRTDLLATLLPEVLTALQDEALPVGRRRVLVADNDPDTSARDLTLRLAATTPPGLVEYVHVEQPGVAAARNACLEQAAPDDLLIFLDDDQQPRPGWLARLIGAHQRTGADFIAAPTRPTYPAPAASWIVAGPFHDGPTHPRDTLLGESAVTNCVIDMRAVTAMGLRFPDIGTRGGEDSWFTVMFAQRGGVIAWEPDAIVDEPVPAPRTPPRWVLTRSLGNGIIAGRLRARSGPHPLSLTTRARTSASGMIRVGGGMVRAKLGLLRRDPALLGGGLHTTFRGLGMAVGAWDLVYDEYARDPRHRWRIDADPVL